VEVFFELSRLVEEKFSLADCSVEMESDAFRIPDLPKKNL